MSIGNCCGTTNIKECIGQVQVSDKQWILHGMERYLTIAYILNPTHEIVIGALLQLVSYWDWLFRTNKGKVDTKVSLGIAQHSFALSTVRLHSLSVDL